MTSLKGQQFRALKSYAKELLELRDNKVLSEAEKIKTFEFICIKLESVLNETPKGRGNRFINDETRKKATAKRKQKAFERNQSIYNIVEQLKTRGCEEEEILATLNQKIKTNSEFGWQMINVNYAINQYKKAMEIK